MSAWFPVAGVADLPPGAAVAAVAGGVEVALFNVDGELCALDGRCLHKGGSLAEGTVRDGIVTCPLHFWRYELRTGVRLGASGLRLACHPVRVREGRVEVAVDPPPVLPASLRERLLHAGRVWRDQQSSPGE